VSLSGLALYLTILYEDMNYILEINRIYLIIKLKKIIINKIKNLLSIQKSKQTISVSIYKIALNSIIFLQIKNCKNQKIWHNICRVVQEKILL